MRLPRLLIVTLLLLLAALPAAHAQVASSPYAVVVPVADTSDAQRDQAFATALGQVLTRVAGGQDLRSNAGYGEALGKAASMVQKFQYQRAATGLVLEVEFEPGTVRRLVAKLGVQSVGIKPPVLLLVQGSDGHLLDQAALASLATVAGARGTNVVYPDGNPPDPAKVAAAEPAALVAVNRQYHTGLVLLGKLRNGAADWTLISGGQAQHWSGQGANAGALLGDAGNGLADRLGKQFNVIGAGPSEGKLWVSGLESAMDYANLVALLQEDPSVKQVQTLGAQNDGVLLYVKASAPISALAANLAAGGHLLLQGEPHPGADANLRWLR
ncbi:hypothetical protein RHOFW104T7_09725 [Rhodanobacter thiooxydans]|uniref:DUF2066 domain-containing protein n=1 Tax=Rhodanobacter thiooxydans TaxID=416169 RepID=A0A154QIW2_9GAMM|nr:DUF2066 domain-containing protein [Rhodanobacter thiooxydans]EIM02129.1 hypothetical protein UUA_02526 [Rhodanobacter thiooxydans LCS2]KZC24243.1 hypothetical protein RHOFW104T7_09725 [Rhodanobacter thiooxydans]MCW0200830.1 DUF2066 domain-containing protein [Rhodanobacter thiooxydans]